MCSFVQMQIGQPVQFVEAFIATTTTGTRNTSEIPSLQFPTTRVPVPPPSEEREPLQVLSSGAVAGIVIAILIVVILIMAVVIVAIIALVLGYRNSGRMKLSLKRQSSSFPQTYVHVLRHDAGSHLTSEWQSMPIMVKRNDYADLPTTGGNGSTNERTEL